jgi:NAD(P)-dependent dehydrogenase (short-subunit alcohol dehydrogenase family)
MDLTGKVAVITGSGRGIGRAYAKALASAGSAVVINDVDGDVAASTVQEITAAGGKAVAEVVAVGDAAAADALVNAAVSNFGRLDVMCTNAGILRDKTCVNMSDEDFDAVIATHMRGTFTCARAALAHWKEKGEGGRLVLVSSIAGLRGNFGQTNYAAAKAGIASMARTLALEAEKYHVSVNAIVPNAITRLIATIPGMAPLVELAESGQPLPEMARHDMGMGTPEDVAPLLVFLASDAGANISGQCIGIGGDKLSLWSCPAEVSIDYREGGWTADAIAVAWGKTVAQKLEPYGIPFLGGKS